MILCTIHDTQKNATLTLKESHLTKGLYSVTLFDHTAHNLIEAKTHPNRKSAETFFDILANLYNLK